MRRLMPNPLRCREVMKSGGLTKRNKKADLLSVIREENRLDGLAVRAP